MSLETNPSSFLSDRIVSMVWKNRKQMAVIVVIAFILSVVVAFILPVKYRGTTLLFAPTGNNMGDQLLSGMPGTKDYMAFGGEDACEQMAQILNSEAVMRVMMKKFNLIHHYKIAPDEPGKYALLKYYYSENFNFSITEYRSIRVAVNDRYPDTAALMANTVVQVADSVYGAILKQRAMAAFNIVKHEYDSANRELNVLQDSMNFYRKQGILYYEYQVKELTRGYSDAVVKGSPSAIEQIDDKLKPFQVYGKGYWNMYNALFDHYKWMQQLKEQYEEAKVNAEKAVTPFFIIEKAITPDKKVFPIRWLVVVGGTFAGFFIGLFLLLVIKRFSGSKQM